MKIKISYDLLEQIGRSENGYSLKDPLKHLMNGSAIALGLSSPFLIVINNPKLDCLLIASVATCDILFANMIKTSTKNMIISLSNLSLDLLVDELIRNDVITTKELLKDSKLDSKKYKLEYKDADSSIKSIKEYKYIDVPLTNGYTETLVQEHFLGSENYDLSIGENIKSKQFRPLKNGI